MNKLFKGALIVAACVGLQATSVMASGTTQGGLLQYAQEPTNQQATHHKSIKVAGWRGRRNRAIAAGVAIGVGAAIIAPRVVYPRRYRTYRRVYSARHCRNLIVRCDAGSNSSCRKWNRRCR